MKKFFFTYFVFIIHLYSFDSSNFKYKQYNFNKEQLDNYELSYRYGKLIDEHKIIMGIMYAESNGRNITIGDRVNSPFKRSYGIMQVKLGTYEWMRNNGELMREDLLEEEILYKLMYNKAFNVYTASSFYNYLVKKCGSKKMAVIAYNTGLCNPKGGSKEYKKGQQYFKIVNEFIKFIDNSKFDKYIETRINLAN